MKYRKLVSEDIASPITKMRKIARISSIPKVKVPTKPSDYIPVSVLPVLSKVFERIILNQVKQFIDKHEVYQYLSFIKRHRREDHRVTASNNDEWQQVKTSDNDWQRVVQPVKQRSYFKEWMIAIVSITKIVALLQGMDGWY